MEAALKINSTSGNEIPSVRLSIIGSGPLELRARTAVEQLVARSAGRRMRVIGFFASEKFRRAFRAAFEELATPEDRLILENTRSRRLRDLEDIARRAWLYGRLGATSVVVETGREETAASVIRHLGMVVASHGVNVMTVPSETLEAELLNGWQVAYLCRKTDVNPSGFTADRVERIPVGALPEDGARVLKLRPRSEDAGDGLGGLSAAGEAPQLGLLF